jgi:hypothetical protein
MEWLGDGLIAAAGYALSIYTWPWVRSVFTGTEAEIARLQAAINTLRGK